MRDHKHQPRLKKELGLFRTTIYGIGIILGAGIYAIIGEGAGLAGNSLWLSFLIAAIVAGFTGLSYAELSSVYAKEAAEYNYTKKAFRRESLSFVIGWMMIIAGVMASAAVALAFSGYFSKVLHYFGLFGYLEAIPNPLVAVAGILIALLSLLNFSGIRESANFNIISTIVEFSGLLLIIILGLGYIGSPGINYLEMPHGFSGLVGASALIFFAFIGFEDIVNISEETKEAKKTVPKALLIALAVCTVLYILVALSSVSILEWNLLAGSDAPLMAVAAAAGMPNASIIISIIALFATGNTLLIIMIAASRIMYGMSSDRSMPDFLSKIHPRTHTPHFAVFSVMALSLMAVLVGNLKVVASLTDIGIFVAYLFVNLSLIKLRYSKPEVKRPFKSPVNIGKFPVLASLGAVTCVVMLLHFSSTLLLAGTLVAVIGYIIYRGMNPS